MGHWGRMFWCQSDRDGCQLGVNGTPRNGFNHARQIRAQVDRCPHGKDERDDDV